MKVRRSLGIVVLMATAAALLLTGCSAPVAAAPGPEAGPAYSQMLRWANAEAGEWALERGDAAVSPRFGPDSYMSWANAEAGEWALERGDAVVSKSGIDAYLSWANAEASEWTNRLDPAFEISLSTYLSWANAEREELTR